MSALLTTTMTYMKTVIDGFEAAGQGHIKMAVGGAPISQMFADEIGADGYGQNASAAVDLFLRLARSRPDAVATYKILYWQEIPSQIKAEDDARRRDAAARPAVHGAHRSARRAARAAGRRRLPRAVEVERRSRSATARRRTSREAVKRELEAAADW